MWHVVVEFHCIILANIYLYRHSKLRDLRINGEVDVRVCCSEAQLGRSKAEPLFFVTICCNDDS